LIFKIIGSRNQHKTILMHHILQRTSFPTCQEPLVTDQWHVASQATSRGSWRKEKLYFSCAQNPKILLRSAWH